MEKKRIDNLDLMKTIAIIMVVMLHVPLFYVDFNKYDTIFVMLQYAIRIAIEGVSIFLFVNGFLLFYRENLDIKKHYIKTAKLFVIFVVWAFIIAIIGLALDKNVVSFNYKDVINVVINTKNNAQYSGYLWFLQGLIALYLIYPMIWFLYKNKNILFRILFYLVAIFSVGKSLYFQIADILEFAIDRKYFINIFEFLDVYNPFDNQGYLFFFMLGGMVLYYKDKIKKNKILLGIIGLISWILAFLFAYYMTRTRAIMYDQTFNTCSVFIGFMIIGLFAITINYKNTNWFTKIIEIIGKNTMGIYLIHFPLVYLFRYIFDINSANDIFELGFFVRLLVTIVVFMVSTFLSVVIKKIPYVNKLISI